jgi:DNA topoisomerase-1
VGKIIYNKDTELPWRRVKKGSSFSFINEKGGSVSKNSADRIQKLSIPPAWEKVLISKNPQNYIQAIGLDSAGRKQYIYHPDWVKKNQEHKFDQLVSFGEKLPTLRSAVSSHMKERSLSQNRVIATVIWLLEHTFIRVGNKTYAEENGSYGLTTMREKHVHLKGNKVKFKFKGKSGVFHELDVTQPTVVKTIKECIELPGYELFQYIDEDNNKRVIDSGDVNDYLQTYTGSDFSAKDFRTWGGSVLAGDSFYKKGNPTSKEELKENILEVITKVSKYLGNTKKVCRTYYIHPAIINSYEKNILVPHFERSYSRKLHKKLSLTPEEYATWSLIKDS